MSKRTPRPVPPPTGLVAWLFDRDERVRRVLWVLYPACAVAIVALLAPGRGVVTLPAAVLGPVVVAAIARRLRTNRSRNEVAFWGDRDRREDVGDLVERRRSVSTRRQH